VTAAHCTDEPTPKSAGSVENYKVTDLEPDTTYYFVIKVSDEIPAWSGLSNPATNTTLPEPDVTPPDRITDLEAINPTYNTITLTWTAPGDDNDKGSASSYDIRYAGASITDVNWDALEKVNSPPTPRPAKEKETFIVTGLETNTTYYFAVKSADEVPNWSPLSNTPSLSTLELPENMQELVLSVTIEKSILNSGESTTVTIEVLEELEKSPVPQAALNITSNNEDLLISPTSGLSDKTGKLIVTLKAPLVAQTKTIGIDIEATKLGFISNRTTLQLTVNPLREEPDFDVIIIDYNITFSKDEIKAGEQVTIHANLTVEDKNQTGFVLRIFVGDEQVGFDETFIGVPENGTVTIEKTWSAIAGEHIVRVEVAPLIGDNTSANAGKAVETELGVSEEEMDDSPAEVIESKSASSSLFYIIMIVIVIIILITLLILNYIVRRAGQNRAWDENITSPPEKEQEAETAKESEGEGSEEDEQ
jgi:hypothetical protein